jgi:hypothetical protein
MIERAYKRLIIICLSKRFQKVWTVLLLGVFFFSVIVPVGAFDSISSMTLAGNDSVFTDTISTEGETVSPNSEIDSGSAPSVPADTGTDSGEEIVLTKDDDAGNQMLPVKILSSEGATTAISSPINGSVVSGIVNITAAINGIENLSKVEFYIDGLLAGEDSTAPYMYSWDTAGVTGEYMLCVKSFGPEGLIETSEIITVTVTNTLAFASSDPSNGAVGVSVTKPISINFNKVIEPGPNYNDINVCLGETIIPAAKEISENKITITPSENWQYGTAYTVNLLSGSIQDTDGNQLNEGRLPDRRQG